MEREVYMYMCILLLCRANMESETRVENKRIVRRMQQESVEHAMEEKLQMAEREQEYREKQKRQEEQLTKVCTHAHVVHATTCGQILTICSLT